MLTLEFKGKPFVYRTLHCVLALPVAAHSRVDRFT
jgi:hypothetical protein